MTLNIGHDIIKIGDSKIITGQLERLQGMSTEDFRKDKLRHMSLSFEEVQSFERNFGQYSAQMAQQQTMTEGYGYR